MRFTAVRPIEEERTPETSSQEGHTPNRYAVDRHRQEFAPQASSEKVKNIKSNSKVDLLKEVARKTTQGIRTDSPTADLEAVNLVISWASSMKL